jgi:zinc D-Ala-D-Ala carboxypeptidase
MIVTSGFRCPDHNRRVAGSGVDGPHTKGRAADIRIFGAEAHRLIDIALTYGMSGIGIKQSGPYEGRYIHLDCLSDDGKHPRPWVWSY